MKATIRFLLPYIRPYWKKALIALILSFPLAAIKGAQVKLVKHIVDTLIADLSFQDALLYSGALLGLGILNYPCRFYHFYLMRYVVDKGTCAIRSNLYMKLQRLPLSFFSQNKSGNLVSILLNDTNVLAQGFKSSIDLLREPLTAIVMLGMAFYSDWQLTLVIFLVAPLFVLIFQKSGKLVKVNQEEVQEHLASMTHCVSEGVIGQKVTKAFNLQKYVLKRFEWAQDLFFHYQMRTSMVEENAHPLVELVGALAFSGVILFAYYRIHHGNMTPGDFFSFVTALALLMDPLRKFSQANVKLHQSHGAGIRLLKILSLEEEKEEGDEELKGFFEKIDIKNVSFSYGDRTVLSNFTMTLKKGERVALVGLSGSGKSTLINLLLRLYPLQGGEILIDGVPLQRYSLESVRRTFALVSQDLFLFHDTIRENLLIGNQRSEEEIQQALQVASAQDFVEHLPQGLNTVIGDRGAKLSGGQGQRITIARALLQGTPVLLFDEATSALDNESEKKVQEALDKLSGQKTILAVAHRLSTVQDFDNIIVLHDGKKIEEGRHEELMQQKGEYWKLYNLSLRS